MRCVTAGVVAGVGRLGQVVRPRYDVNTKLGSVVSGCKYDCDVEDDDFGGCGRDAELSAARCGRRRAMDVDDTDERSRLWL